MKYLFKTLFLVLITLILTATPLYAANNFFGKLAWGTPHEDVAAYMGDPVNTREFHYSMAEFLAYNLWLDMVPPNPGFSGTESYVESFNGYTFTVNYGFALNELYRMGFMLDVPQGYIFTTAEARTLILALKDEAAASLDNPEIRVFEKDLLPDATPENLAPESVSWIYVAECADETTYYLISARLNKTSNNFDITIRANDRAKVAGTKLSYETEPSFWTALPADRQREIMSNLPLKWGMSYDEAFAAINKPGYGWIDDNKSLGLNYEWDYEGWKANANLHFNNGLYAITIFTNNKGLPQMERDAIYRHFFNWLNGGLEQTGNPAGTAYVNGVPGWQSRHESSKWRTAETFARLSGGYDARYLRYNIHIDILDLHNPINAQDIVNKDTPEPHEVNARMVADMAFYMVVESLLPEDYWK